MIKRLIEEFKEAWGTFGSYVYWLFDAETEKEIPYCQHLKRRMFCQCCPSDKCRREKNEE